MSRRPPKSTLFPTAPISRSAQPPVWLDPGVAADIPFTAPADNDNRAHAEALRAAAGDAPVDVVVQAAAGRRKRLLDRKSTRLNSSHANISYAVFCLKKKTLI